MDIGIKIKAAREARKMTQEELGIACGTTKQTIFKYETGVVTNIPLDRIEKMADVLNISPVHLLGWEHFLTPAFTVENNNSTSEESKLINLYRELNEEGQEKLVDYADDMVRSGKYIKSDEVIVDKEA